MCTAERFIVVSTAGVGGRVDSSGGQIDRWLGGQIDTRAEFPSGSYHDSPVVLFAIPVVSFAIPPQPEHPWRVFWFLSSKKALQLKEYELLAVRQAVQFSCLRESPGSSN